MVTVSARPEPGSKVVLEIEVAPAEVDRHFATAYRHLAERTRVPGFRPGKAPRQVIDRFVGRGSVLAEAIDHLVTSSYDAALDQSEIVPVDQPKVDIDPDAVQEGATVRFTATVPVRPEVRLGAYTDYPFELEVPKVTDEEVEAMLTELRERQATYRPVDGREARHGDVALVSYVGTIDGEPFEGGTSERTPIEIGAGRMIGDFEEQLVGLKVDDTKAFEVTFPDDYRAEALRGKRARFEVTMVDLREKLLPALDDEFARSVGEEVKSVDELRAELRDAMMRRAEAEARHRYADRIIEFATANASVEIPEVMIGNEVEIMRDELRGRLAQQRIGMDQYLTLAKQSPEELTGELREPATRRVKTLLVLSAIAEKEGIDATEAEIDAEVAEQLQRAGDAPRLRDYLGSRRGRAYLRMTLRNRKLVDTLIDRSRAE